MRKGQNRYGNIPLYKMPTNLIYNDEIFLPITEKIVPDVLPYYLISNYGRLWHKYKERFLNNNIDSKGYLYKPLALKNGKACPCRIHRLVMMTFNYIPGCEELVVNHIDGNKCNPYLYNLEWVTQKENILHAVQSGLRNNISYDDDCIGREFVYNNDPEDIHPISTPGQIAPKSNPEDIEKVCQLLQEGELTFQQISKQTGVAYHVILAIQGKRTWRNISDKYDIKPRKVASNLTEEQVHLICKYFEDVKRPEEVSIRQYCRDALSSIGLSEHTHLQLRSVLKILARETYSYISKDYNF